MSGLVNDVSNVILPRRVGGNAPFVLKYYCIRHHLGFVRSRVIWEIERENISFSARTLPKLLNGAFFIKKIL